MQDVLHQGSQKTLFSLLSPCEMTDDVGVRPACSYRESTSIDEKIGILHNCISQIFRDVT